MKNVTKCFFLFLYIIYLGGCQEKKSDYPPPPKEDKNDALFKTHSESLSSLETGFRLASYLAKDNNFYFSGGEFVVFTSDKVLKNSSQSKSFALTTTVIVAGIKIDLPDGYRMVADPKKFFVGEGLNAIVFPIERTLKGDKIEMVVIKKFRPIESLSGQRKTWLRIQPHLNSKKSSEKGLSAREVIDRRSKAFATSEISEANEWRRWGNPLEAWKVDGDPTVVLKTLIEGDDLKDIIRKGEFDAGKQDKLIEFLLDLNHPVHQSGQQFVSGSIKDKHGGNIRWDKKRKRWVLVDAHQVDITDGNDGMKVMRRNMHEFYENMLPSSTFKKIARKTSPNRIQFHKNFSKQDMANFLDRIKGEVKVIASTVKASGNFKSSLHKHLQSRYRVTDSIHTQSFYAGRYFEEAPQNIKSSFIDFLKNKLSLRGFILPQSYSFADFEHSKIISQDGKTYISRQEFLRVHIDEFMNLKPDASFRFSPNLVPVPDRLKYRRPILPEVNIFKVKLK